jgi:DNA-binding transcriptional LysR family regulator
LVRVDPYSLRLFVTVAQERSLARAAAKEHIAASALSRRIANLERAFGVSLIIRSARGIDLTEAGKLALSRGTKLEEDLRALARELQEHTDQVKGTVRIFANPSAVVGFLPERLKRFSANYPFVQLVLEERMTEEVLRACLDDRADLGVGVGTSARAGLESWHFADDPLMVVLPARHPLKRRTSISFAEVLKNPLVTVQSGGTLDRLLRKQARDLRTPLRVSVSVSGFDAACRMVEAGLGIAIVPNSAASAYAGSRRFVRLPLNESWSSRELRLYALRKTPRPRAVDALIAALRA